MKKLLIIIITGLILGCTSSIKERVITKADFIRILAKKIGFINLPYSHNLNLDKEDYKYLIDSKSIDTLFFDNYDNQIIGVIPDTSKFFAILYYGIGDDLYPSIRTFSKNGDKIDSKMICYGFCGGCGCECDSCSDVTTIGNDLKIKLTHYIKATECDSVGEKIPETTTCKIFTIDGYVQSNGMIILNKQKEEDCD